MIHIPIEYCGTKKPLVRSFEPLIAENEASECIEESHRLNFVSDSLLYFNTVNEERLDYAVHALICGHRLVFYKSHGQSGQESHQPPGLVQVWNATLRARTANKSDYSQEILPPSPSFLPLISKEFTGLTQRIHQLIKSPTD